MTETVRLLYVSMLCCRKSSMVGRGRQQAMPRRVTKLAKKWEASAGSNSGTG